MAFSYNTSNLAKKLFINNEYVESKNSAKLSVYNPVDNSLVADDIALAGVEDVDIAVAAAEKAFPAWRAMSTIQRRGIMLKFADLVEKNAIVLAELTRITLGAPYEAFGKFETGLCAEVCRKKLCSWEKHQTDEIRRPSDTTLVGSTNSPANHGLKKTVSSKLCAMSPLV